MNLQQEQQQEQEQAAVETTEQDAPIGAGDNENTNKKETAIDFDNPEIKTYIEKQISEGIKKALQGTPPKANTIDNVQQERAKFDKMTYKERLNLFKANPHKYNELVGGKQ